MPSSARRPRPPLFPYTPLFRSPRPPAGLAPARVDADLAPEDADLGIDVAAPDRVDDLVGRPVFAELLEAHVAVRHLRGERARMERSEEHTSELQSPCNLVCRLLHAARDLHSFPTRRSSDLRVPQRVSRQPGSTPTWPQRTRISGSTSPHRIGSMISSVAPSSPSSSRRTSRCGTFAASARAWRDRKSTRLNSSHLVISYAVFCTPPATSTLSLHAALPISASPSGSRASPGRRRPGPRGRGSRDRRRRTGSGR